MGVLADAVPSLAPLALCFGTGLLTLRVLRPVAKARFARRRPWRELVVAVVGAAIAGSAVGVLVGLLPGRDPLPGAGILYLLAVLIYLLALAACLSSWRVPLGELVALLLLVPALPFQLLVHAEILTTPGNVGLYLLPPSSFMVDLPSWAVAIWSHGGWNPLGWPKGMAGPGFGTGALVWTAHVGLLMGLAGWGRQRQWRRQPPGEVPEVADVPGVAEAAGMAEAPGVPGPPARHQSGK